MTHTIIDGRRYQCSMIPEHPLLIVSPTVVNCAICDTLLRPLQEDVKPVAQKFDSGKLRYDLVDAYALAWLVSALTYGVRKYAAWNWLNFSKEELREKYFAAMMRHFEAFRMGEDFDEETGLPHLALGSFGAMVLTATFAPRDLDVVRKLTAEAIRRWDTKKALAATAEK